MFEHRIAALVSFSLFLVLTNVALAAEYDMQSGSVVMTATKTPKKLQDVTQSVTVITGDELKNSSATTVAEVLRNVAGVDIRSYGSRGAASFINLRGAGSPQVLVLLDGKRLNSASSGGFDLSALPVTLDAIERIEIVRGPASALYGTDAVGGVVNIITKMPAEPSVSISGSMGAQGYTSLGAGLSGRQNSLYYALSVARERSHGYRDNSGFEQVITGIKAGYNLDASSSIEGSVDYLNKELGVPGSVQFLTPLAHQANKDTVSGLRYQTRFSKELDASINLYRTEGRITYANPDTLFPEYSEHRSVTSGSDMQVNWRMDQRNLFSVGAEAREDHLVSSIAGGHTASLSSTHLQDEISVNEVLILVLGGRNDSHSVYGDRFSPHASARVIDPETRTIVRASMGKSFRAPTLDDLYWPDTARAVGNPDLRPEISEEYDVGIEQALGDGIMVKVAKFDRKVTDLIEWQPDTAFQYSPVNIGKARIRGIEAEARFILSDSITFSLNYTQMDPVNELTGEKIYYTIPKMLVGGSLQMALDKETCLSLEGRRVKNYVKPGEEKWDYYTVDGRINDTFFSQKGQKGDIFIGMKNMFNRKYESVRGYPMPASEFYGGIALRF
jgi:outer membrane cobalamin receptor